MASILVILFFISVSTVASDGNPRSRTETYFLSGNKINPCYDEPYISDRAECLERLLALYYSDNFSFNCPKLVHWLARRKCEGCPWDNINASAITPTISRNLNRSELFHAPAPNCSISLYMKGIASSDRYLYLSFFGFAIPMFSATFLGISDANGSPTTPQVLGSRLKEPIYFVSLWILFFVGYGMSVAGHEIYDTCHDTLSVISLHVGDWINLAIMMWTSLWRCRYLEARDRPEEVLSWGSYRDSILYRTSSVWNKRLVDFVCGAGLTLILCSVGLEQSFEKDFLSSVCKLGSYKSIPYGLIQYSKIVTGILAVAVYSLGPPTRPVLFYIRYIALTIILLVSVCFLYVMRLQLYDTQSLSKLVPHVADSDIAGPLHAGLPAYSFSVALLGVAEPLRLGWPKNCNPKFDAEGTM